MMQRKGQPIMILTCQHDSHYFEERTIVVNDIIKVGRAVARSKASPNNAIFDCKVLSRNHAVIWFSSDEFWLRDTNSSNGTFVNNTRVSKRDDSDYCDRQIFSGDVIRFGVDVVEHDTTHGCIIASVTLILPNGQEAKPKLGHTGDALPSGLISINNEQMFQISCFLNDAIFREQALDKKLEALRQALQQATLASELGWQAMLNEEKLLQKFNLYESQMRMFKEELPENSLKMRLSDLLEEKNLQEAESKTQLTKLINDKEIALQRIKDLERTVDDLECECTHLRNEYASAQDACSNISDEYKTNLSTVSQRLNELTTERNQLNDQLQHASRENTALKEQLERVSHELAVTKELYEQVQSKGPSGLVNGLSYADDAYKESNASVNSKGSKAVVDLLKANDNAIPRNQPVEQVSGDELMVESRKLEANEYISDSIRDFHRALELIRVLDAKVSALAVTTDLDEEKKLEGSSEAVINDTSTDFVSDVSSLSSSSIESLVKRIVRHNETAMTSLHAYLRQVNPSAAAELINKIYLSSSGVDDGSEALLASVEGKTFKRPSFLTLTNLVDKAVEAAPSSACDEGVTVAGADSLSASPTVSSGNGSLSFSMSLDTEEVAHLRECVRLANAEIEQYKAHIADLQKTGWVETALATGSGADDSKRATSEQDLEEMHAECCVLRARLGDIEEQMEQTRENHRRLVEEARHHRNEVEQLHCQRAELEAALVESQAQITKLRQQARDHQHPRVSTAPASNNHLSPTTSYVADTPVHTDRLELVPGRLVTVRNLVPLEVFDALSRRLP
ncbi:sarcolemmal membrane associated protein [Echinococcus multilocularis]|uniref:Sarcolemmal membrane associated protein n=1 Tax=Echinococcus multilocularis TaxID=6211 RepID=A0A068Y6U3_ECHMU|nr:sarcolemmal membrane associated protein [Echinococcus multilocularis]